MVRGISKTNLVGSDDEIHEDDRVGGSVNTVSISFRYIYPTDLSIVVVASTNVPEVSEVIKAMGNWLELRYAMGTGLLVEGKVVGYLPDMKGARECLGCWRVID